MNYLNPTHEFILGPLTPSGLTTWFDRTQHERGLAIGDALPATPPPTDPDLNTFVLTQYYDLPLALYNAHTRTGDARHLQNARKAADSWWLHPWQDAGRVRAFLDGAGAAPRHAGLGGLMLRAADGRAELWDWIYEYARQKFDVWLKWRIDNRELYYNVREGAFCLQYAAWLSRVLPDSYPLQAGGTVTDGAVKRSALLADAEAVALRYFGRLQHADGSWRWDSAEGEWAADDGGRLYQSCEPFMQGLLNSALCDLHAASSDATVKTGVLDQLTRSLRFLYDGGPYRRDEVPGLPGVHWRSFWYFYGGGTSVNPTRFEKGNCYPYSEIDTKNNGWWTVKSERQGLGLILPAFGYVYSVTKDPYFKAAGDDLWDAAYGETDKQYCLMDGTAKNYNQHARRAASYLAWTAGTPVPVPAPIPAPAPIPTQPSPTPTPTPALPATRDEKVKLTVTAEREAMKRLRGLGYEWDDRVSTTTVRFRKK